jgi:polyhydroxyalkanoate synthesis regulator phasin
MEDKMMIDASMILHRDTLNQMIGLSQADALGGFYISNTLFNLIKEKRLNSIARQIGIYPPWIDSGAIYKFVISEMNSSKISRYECKKQHDSFYENLVKLTDNKDIAQIYLEEWEFLTTNSWLVSKGRDVFDKIVEAGATSLQVSKNTFDEMVRITLKKERGVELSPNDRIKATSKWIAVGGSVLTDLIPQFPKMVINAAAGIFLLCDP